MTKGPLLLLKRCLEGEERVRVVTRHACGLRGVATGAAHGQLDFNQRLILYWSSVH